LHGLIGFSNVGNCAKIYKRKCSFVGPLLIFLSFLTVYVYFFSELGNVEDNCVCNMDQNSQVRFPKTFKKIIFKSKNYSVIIRLSPVNITALE